MVDRTNKPSALEATPGLQPQAQVTISPDNSRVSASLPSGESIEVLLYGATVLSWKDATGDEKLWMSDAATFAGPKAVRGGIPLVFPVFLTAPDHEVASKLPQHGFARTSRWEFLGKSTSESSSDSVKLDFGLSPENLDDAIRQVWPYKFGLLYSVTLNRESLKTALVITNEGDVPFEFQTLLHTYFRVKDISSVQVAGLENSPYVDGADAKKAKTQSSDPIAFSGETDRVYKPVKGSDPLVISESGAAKLRIVRENLDDVVVWNPWNEKAAAIPDFEPKDGWKNMLCAEAGAVRSWQKLEKGDAFEGSQTVYLK